jgi:hypothetical protein
VLFPLRRSEKISLAGDIVVINLYVDIKVKSIVSNRSLIMRISDEKFS